MGCKTLNCMHTCTSYVSAKVFGQEEESELTPDQEGQATQHASSAKKQPKAFARENIPS